VALFFLVPVCFLLLPTTLNLGFLLLTMAILLTLRLLTGFWEKRITLIFSPNLEQAIPRKSAIELFYTLTSKFFFVTISLILLANTDNKRIKGNKREYKGLHRYLEMQ